MNLKSINILMKIIICLMNEKKPNNDNVLYKTMCFNFLNKL